MARFGRGVRKTTAFVKGLLHRMRSFWVAANHQGHSLRKQTDHFSTSFLIRRRVILVFAFIVILFFALGVGFLGYSYILPQGYFTFDQFTPRITIVYPTFLSVGDEREVFVTVSNNGRSTITNTMVVLAYESSAPLFSVFDQGSAVKFGELVAGELKSGTVKLRLDAASGLWLNQARGQTPLKFTLWLASGVHDLVPVGTVWIQIAPFAHLERVFRFVFAGSWGTLSGLWLWLLKQFWDDISKSGKMENAVARMPTSSGTTGSQGSLC